MLAIPKAKPGKFANEEPGAVQFSRSFGAFKLAAILQQIYIRFLKGQTNDQRFSDFGKRIEALVNRANKVYGFNSNTNKG